MFDFMYLRTYEDTMTSSDGSRLARDDRLCLHADVYALGEKYGIPALKEASPLKFEVEASTFPRSARFQDAITIVFTSTADHDRALRDVVVRVLCRHRDSLLEDPEIEATIRRIDGLAYALWKKATTVVQGPTCNACQSVHIRQCESSHGKSKHSPSKDAYFVACDCEHTMYCERHRNSQETRDFEW